MHSKLLRPCLPMSAASCAAGLSLLEERSGQENSWDRRGGGERASLSESSLKPEAVSGSLSVVPGPQRHQHLGNLLEMQALGPHPKPTQAETLGVGPSVLF